jgi:superoxide reductase
MAIENFENDPEAIRKPANPDSLSDFEKKHIPQITLNKECTLSPGSGCVDVHVKVGETEHVMESENYISFIDFYVNRKFLSRTVFTHKHMHPATCIHLNTDSGRLRAIAKCNTHGYWSAKIRLDDEQA